MSKTIKILAFSGSLRKNSFNKKLLNDALQYLPKDLEVNKIDLKDYPIPIYDGDLEKENGIPENAKKIRMLMQESDAFIIASPEYNSGVSGVLKNIIDWTSRADDNTPSLCAYKNKFCFLLSASAGYLGGVRGLHALRSILQNIGVIVIPEMITIPTAQLIYDDQTQRLPEDKVRLIKSGCENLLSLTNK